MYVAETLHVGQYSGCFRLDWDRWVMMGLIGVTVGLIGFLLHQSIDVIADFKWDKANDFIEVWYCNILYSLKFKAHQN